MKSKTHQTLTMTKPHISVIIPCLNEARHIGNCIDSVMRQQEPEGGFEVIVADGMSDDGTRGIVAQLADENPRLRLIDNLGRIVSTGLNQAIRMARGQIIIRLDAHTQYAPNYILSCVQTLEATGADNVGGPWVAIGAGYVSRAIAAAFQCSWVVGGARGHDPEFEGDVDTVYLGCWRRSAFEKFGYFDGELVRNQDDELSLRIVLKGGRIWQSRKIQSSYQPRKSLAALFKQYMQYGYWKVRVMQKHRLPASWRHLVPGMLLPALIILGVTGLFSKLALMLWLVVLSAYGLYNLAASIASAARGGAALLPMLPAVVACYHFGYGCGFWRGVWDFIICNKGARPSFSTLTRSS